MKKTLVNYQIDDDTVKFEVLPISKEDIQSLIDIVKALSSVFTSTDNLDFSFFDDKKENFKTRLGINKDDQPIYSFIAKWYLKDSTDFQALSNFRDNNLTNDIFEHVNAIISFEKIGDIDIPKESAFMHRDGTIREYETGPKRSTYPGITSLLRKTDIGADTEVFYFTTIVSKGAGVGTLWTLKILIPEAFNLGRANDAFLYFTLPAKMIDYEGMVN